MSKIKLKDFEETLASLADIVQAMEKGDLSLEASLKQFERGVGLTKACQQALDQAEQKVKILLEDNETLGVFNKADEDD